MLLFKKFPAFLKTKIPLFKEGWFTLLSVKIRGRDKSRPSLSSKKKILENKLNINLGDQSKSRVFCPNFLYKKKTLNFSLVFQKKNLC